MRSFFLIAVYLAILSLGFQSSFIFVLGYVWVDIFTPQLVAYTLLPSVPVSLIMAFCVFVSLFLLPKDQFVTLRVPTVLTLLFAIWMTATLIWAEVPDAAYAKWNWAIKNVLFSCMIPFFIRSRVQFEAFIWTVVLSGMAHCLTFGAKVVISGGGYGRPLGLIEANSGYGEGSTLAMFSICLIPLILYLYKWQTLIPYPKATKWMLIGFIVAALLTSLGTYARTGLISIAVLSSLLILQSRHKVYYFFGAVVLAAVLSIFVSDDWVLRMSTIGDGADQSAMGRVAVWLWTLDYVALNPLGGSFDTYRINQSSLSLEDGTSLVIAAKASHSIYFEILAELGFLGILLFASLVFVTLKYLREVRRTQLSSQQKWFSDTGIYLRFSLLVYLVGGLFIGIAFQPYLYYVVALAVALNNLAQRLKANGE
jgi:probable O-glycosylation ligase (exosortase A-associated)